MGTPTLADLIATTLATRGLSQRDLAREMGIAQQTVSKWVTGAADPRLSMIRGVAIALDLDPADLGRAIIGRTPARS